MFTQKLSTTSREYSRLFRAKTASTHLPEDGMFLLKVRRVVEREEELAVVGAGLVLVRHRHLPAVVELDSRVNLVSKRLAVNALAPVPLPSGVAPLNHELPDNAVEYRVVVVLFSRLARTRFTTTKGGGGGGTP